MLTMIKKINVYLILYMPREKNLLRIRYYTSHPKDMTKDLIDAHKECSKLMPLLHLPFNQVLIKQKGMNRKHNIKEYLKIINILKEKNPRIEFASDFIIAYPGKNRKTSIKHMS